MVVEPPQNPAPVKPSTPSSTQNWNTWLVSRLFWTVGAIVVAAVMFLAFMKIAYR